MSVATNKALLCVLLAGGDTQCLNMCYGATAPAQSHPKDFQIGAEKSRPFYAKGRLELGEHSSPFVLARPNPLKLTNLSASALSRVVVGQAEYYGEKGDSHARITGSEAELTGYVKDGAYYIDVIPLALGRCEFNIIVFFADGGISSERMLVNTVPPREKPTKITIGNAGVQDVDTVFLKYSGEADKSPNSHRLLIRAKYSGIKQPIDIPSRFATFAVRDANVDSTVSIDNTGYIRANHTGHSLVESTYQDTRYLTCIVVTASDVGYTGRVWCQDLLKKGERIGR